MRSRHRPSGTKHRKSTVQRAPRHTSHFARWLTPPVIIASLITAFGACSSGKPPGLVELESIPECDASAAPTPRA